MNNLSPLEVIFFAALEKASPQERAAYLDDACAGDPDTRSRVERMLTAQARAGSFLEQPAHAIGPTIDEPVSEKPGTVIGPYKLLEQIGEGGFGVVFMAEQTQPVRRKVALKVLKPGMDTRHVVLRFEAERQALAIMDHPNIARVFDGGATTTGRPYFVMELVRGVPITDYCDQNHLTPRERLVLFIPVCQAVQHAHQKGIIHRDLKPSNVLVSVHDTTPVVKVIDFGVAKALGQELTDKTLFTGFAQMIGTPLYMSPEQAGQSSLDIDTRSDIYSLGVLLYELLTGTTPFDKDRFKQAAYDEIRRIIREEEPPKPSTRLSELSSPLAPREESGTRNIPPTSSLASVAALRHTEPTKLTKLVRGELDWIVMKALDKDRSRRYETANSFAMDVQRYLADEPVQACPPSAMYRFRKFARRNKAALVATALVTAALVLTVVVLAISNVWVTWERNEKTQALLDREAALAKESTALTKAKEQEDLAKKNAAEAKKQQGMAEAEAVRAKEQEELATKNAKEAEKQQGVAQGETARAKEQELLARHGFYAAQMNLAQQASESGNPARLLQLLETQRPRFDQEDLRSFEWYYLWRQSHRGLRFSVRSLPNLVQCVAFSPDGKTVALGGRDLSVRLWDANTGQERASLSTFGRGFVACLAFSPDSKVLAAGMWDGTVTLWDPATGKRQATLLHRDPENPVLAVAFSANGKMLFTGATRALVCWNLDTLVQRYVLHENSERVALTQDGNTLATGSKLWDLSVDPPQVKVELPGATGPLAFSPDGTILAAGLTLYDATTGERRAAFQGHRGQVNSVAFSPDGKLLASASSDRTVRLWDVVTGQTRSEHAHLAEVWSVACSSDGQAFACGCIDGTLWVWDIVKEPDPDTLTHPGAVTFVEFAPEANTLISGGGWPTKLWNVTTGVERATLPPRIESGSVSADGRMLATVDGTTVKVWDIGTARELATLQGTLPGSRLAISPSGKTVATCLPSLRLWDVETRQARLVQDPRPADNTFFTAAFSPDGATLATGTRYSLLDLFDVRTGKKRFSIRQEKGWVSIFSVAFSPDGKTVGAGSSQGSVRLWDLERGRLRASLKGHTQAVRSMTFCPDGKTVATGSDDTTAKLWDVATGQELFTFNGHKGAISSMAFAPDGGMLATASSDGTVRLWRAATDALARAPKSELDPDDPHSPVACNDWGERLRQADRTEEAEEAFGEALARLDELATTFPSLKAYREQGAQGHHLRGHAFLSQGEWQKALDDLGAAIKEQPDPHLYIDRAKAYFALRQWQNVVADCTNAIELNPEYSDAYHQRAHAYENLDEWQKALDDFGMAIKRQPQLAKLYIDRGRVHQRLKLDDRAEADFLRATELNPTDASVWAARGDASAELAQWDRAAGALAKASELKPDDVVVRYKQALVCLARNDRDGYRQACAGLHERLDPAANPQLTYWVAWTCVLAPDAVGDLARIVETAEKIVVSDPTKSDYLSTFGATLYRAGRLDEAVERLTEADAAFNKAPAPGQTVVYSWLFLAMAHQRLGHAEESRQWMAKAEQEIDFPKETGVVSWNRRLTLQLLRGEAEAVLDGKE